MIILSSSPPFKLGKIPASFKPPRISKVNEILFYINKFDMFIQSVRSEREELLFAGRFYKQTNFSRRTKSIKKQTINNQAKALVIY